MSEQLSFLIVCGRPHGSRWQGREWPGQGAGEEGSRWLGTPELAVRTPWLTKKLMLSKQEQFFLPPSQLCTSLVPLPSPHTRDRMTAKEPWPPTCPHL